MARKSKKKPNIKVTTLSSVDKRLTQKPFIKKPKVDKESKAQVKKARKNGGAALDKNLDKLKHLNVLIAVILIAESVAIGALAKVVTLPITSNYLNVDSLASQAAGQRIMSASSHLLIEVNMKLVVMAFLFISALFHILIATYSRRSYEKDINQGINRLRWLDYGLTAGIMFVAIGLVNGIYDVVSLLFLFGLVLSLHLYGYLLERQKLISDGPTKQNLIGLLACGGFAWLGVFIYLKNSIFYGVGLDSYVYYIDGSIFIITLALAINAYLSYKSNGRHKSYFYSEKVYMILSLTAKSALAWQLFYGILK